MNVRLGDQTRLPLSLPHREFLLTFSADITSHSESRADSTSKASEAYTWVRNYSYSTQDLSENEPLG